MARSLGAFEAAEELASGGLGRAPMVADACESGGRWPDRHEADAAGGGDASLAPRHRRHRRADQVTCRGRRHTAQSSSAVPRSAVARQSKSIDQIAAASQSPSAGGLRHWHRRSDSPRRAGRPGRLHAVTIGVPSRRSPRSRRRAPSRRRSRSVTTSAPGNSAAMVWVPIVLPPVKMDVTTLGEATAVRDVTWPSQSLPCFTAVNSAVVGVVLTLLGVGRIAIATHAIARRGPCRPKLRRSD